MAVIVSGQAWGRPAASDPSQPARSTLVVDALVARSFGETSYEMNALTPDPRDPTELVPITSKLEFPLYGWLLGLALAWHPEGGWLDRWSVASATLDWQ